MKSNAKLTWDAARKCSLATIKQTRMRERKARKLQYDFNAVMKKAGLA